METKEPNSPELPGCFGFLQPKVHGAGTEYLRVICSVCWVLSLPSPENQLAKQDIFSYPLVRVLILGSEMGFKFLSLQCLIR